MKTGIKVFFDMFGEEMSETCAKLCGDFGGLEKYIEYLAKEVDAVEISTVSESADPQMLLRAGKICKEAGLYFTIHGSIKKVTCAAEFFAPYLELFASGLQSLYSITVHPHASFEDTKKLLSEICDMIDKEGYPARITLENQRCSNETLLHTLCRDVTGIVKEIDSPHLYTCFDFGHQMSNVRKNSEEFDTVEDDFLLLVRHTHIHSYYDGVTHFPLDVGETALEKNISALLAKGYDGVFLLELDPRRYCDRFDIKRSVIVSISVLKTALRQVQDKMAAWEIYENHYAEKINSVRAKLTENKNGIGVIGPSSYVIKLGDTRIAVDPSICTLPVAKAGKAALAELLESCDAVVITHAHKDHFDREIIDKLSENVTLYLPDFMSADRKKVVSVCDGFSESFGAVELTFFESAHSAGENIVPEYGFAVCFDGKNYVFPTDVRDYEKEHKIFENTKAVFAHVWLGKKNALNLYENTYIEKFTDFVVSFGAEKVYLSHIYDLHRKIEDMWSELHCKALEKTLPDSIVLKPGDFIEL